MPNWVLSDKDMERITKAVKLIETNAPKLLRDSYRRRGGRGGGGGSQMRLAETQEAAQADEFISVKLLNASLETTGEAFDATCIFTDNATQADECIPLVQTAKTVIVSNIAGTWYIINPTFAYMPECT